MEQHLFDLVALVVLGAAAQWLAWGIRLPSILLLLLIGFVAGPVTGWISPDELFGGLLLPIVSLAVALILFEGGLSLNLRELHGTGRVVVLLVTVGALVTWLLASVAGRLLIGVDWGLAVLLGAIVIVTGPTVVQPLLRHIKPTGRVGPILKWEGIVIDPIGALVAVLVFEVVVGQHGRAAAAHIAFAVGYTVLVGGGLGLLGAAVLVIVVRRYWVPDHLQTSVATMLVLAAFTGANLLENESGLLAVTAMGIALANQRYGDMRHIVEFKENLRVFLLSFVFILLSARLSLKDMASVGVGTILFVAALVLVVRPACVAVSTLGSSLARRERLFLAWMAPRGIVAAAITAVFALDLEQRGYAQAGLLVPIMFTTIVVTVLVYGLSGAPVAGWLGLRDDSPQGFLLVGAHPFAREIGRALAARGLRVVLADTNRSHIVTAQFDGLPTYFGNILDAEAHDEVDLTGVGRLLALTSNDGVNVLAAEHWAGIFGRENVFRLPLKQKDKRTARVDERLHGRAAFAEGATFEQVERLIESGATVKATRLSAEFDFAAFESAHADGFLALFVVNEAGRVNVVTAEAKPAPRPGQTLVSLVIPDQAEPAGARSGEA